MEEDEGRVRWKSICKRGCSGRVKESGATNGTENVQPEGQKVWKRNREDHEKKGVRKVRRK